MAHIVADRVRETGTLAAIGTGLLGLTGAVSGGYKRFADVCAVNDTQHYCIVSGNLWEVGLGTYSAANVLTRTTVLASSNANAAVSFGTGAKDVFLTNPAAAVKSDSVSVLWFGAKGDGVTNDTVAIQAALDASLTVFFPAGLYVIAGNLTVRSSHVLYGPAGYTAGTTAASAGGAKFLVTTPSGATFAAATPGSALNGFNMANLTMNVSGTPSWVIDLPTVTSLHLSRLSIWVIDGVTATGCIRTQKIGASDSSWVVNWSEVELRVPDAATVYSADIDVSDSVFTGGACTGGIGARWRGAGNCSAMGVRFDRAKAGGAGLTIAKATESRTAHRVIGCQFDANVDTGILLDGDFDDAIVNTNCQPTIIGNQFRTTAVSSVDIRFVNATGPVLSGGTIAGNTHVAGNSTPYSYDSTRWTDINIVHRSSNGGTATILSGTTSIAVTHALAGTPAAKDIFVTFTENPTADPGNIWLSALGPTTFTVNCRTDPGASNLDFSWTAKVQ